MNRQLLTIKSRNNAARLDQLIRLREWASENYFDNGETYDLERCRRLARAINRFCEAESIDARRNAYRA